MYNYFDGSFARSGRCFTFMPMSRNKILWLCSWYPDRVQPFNGDFVQRHARAAALYNDIYVVHVAGDASMKKKKEEFVTVSLGLTEAVVYYRSNNSFYGKVVNHLRWLRCAKESVDRYISENGIPDLIHVHVPFKMGVIARKLKRKFGVPYVVTEHWTIYQPQSPVLYTDQNFFIKSIIKRTVQNCDMLLPVSSDLGELINRQVEQKKFRAIENSVDTDLFYYAERNRVNDVFRFIHVSSMNSLKNAEGLLRSFKAFQQAGGKAELDMVGDTTSAIRSYATSLNFPEGSVRFYGEVSNAEVAALMRTADCFVLFSNVENSPCVIGESLCCGMPVIATTVGGIAELVTEENGILVVARDEKALATAMKEMSENYSMFDRKKIAEHALGRFSYPVIGKKLDDVYQSVLKGK